MEQYLSDNFSINVTGCYIISTSEMYMIFGKFSSGGRQIQTIVFVIKSVYSLIKHKKMIRLHHFYCKVGNSTVFTMFLEFLGKQKKIKWLPHSLLLHSKILAGIDG